MARDCERSNVKVVYRTVSDVYTCMHRRRIAAMGERIPFDEDRINAIGNKLHH